MCGSRNWRDYDSVKRHLARLAPDEIVHGCCAIGADRMADDWARDHKVRVIPCPADWDTHGKAAGPLRNKQMLTYKPELVIAFGRGRGTDGMVRLAEAGGIPVERIPGGPFEHGPKREGA